MLRKTKSGGQLNPFNLTQTGVEHGIYDAEVFRAVVERERHRCDRNNHAFSLAVFAVGGELDAEGFPLRFLDTLPHLVRCTDEVGWLDARRLGVMLPETHAPGAWRFCEKVREAMKTFNIPIVFQVFSYPSPNLPGNEPSDPRQMWFENVMTLAQDSVVSEASQSASSSFWHYSPAHCARVQAACPAGVTDIAGLLGSPPPPWKRTTDVLGALLLLIVFSPVMLLIAAVIRLQSPGPVFFRQKRIGHLGRPFFCWKFRTMHVKAQAQVHEAHLRTLMALDSPMTKLDMQEDPRLIPVGRLLRLSGLDELPQLINVLRGEMSLIGPRPCIPYEYKEYHLWHRRRTDVMPGLTGLWQVSGKNKTTFTEMMRLDIAYSRRLDIWLDLLIVVRTVPALLVQMRDGLAQRVDRDRVAGYLGRALDAVLGSARAGVRRVAGGAYRTGI